MRILLQGGLLVICIFTITLLSIPSFSQSDTESSDDEIVSSITTVKADGTEVIHSFTAGEIAEWQQSMQETAANMPRYGYISDEQSRFTQLNRISHMTMFSAEAFYRANYGMPVSTDALLQSDWWWFSPVEQPYSEGLTIIDRPLGPPVTDLNSVSIMFTGNGYDLSFYDYYGEDEYNYVRYDKSDFISTLVERYSQFPDTSKNIDSEPLNVRIDYLVAATDSLVTAYWKYNLELPVTVEELLGGTWTLREDIIANLEPIPAEDGGWFYLGVAPESGIMYVEYVHTERGPVVQQKIFIENDPLTSDESGIHGIGRYVCVSEKITRDETIPLIDASLPNWGFPVGE